MGLTAGVSPNLDLIGETPIATGRGILVDSSFRTSVDQVYAAGDCAEIVMGDDRRHLVQQVWYTGRRQGSIAGEVIAGEESRYDPGVWFNSAKFLDLEYQTYGQVGLRVPGEASLYWQDPTERQALRIVHVEGRLIGLNFMGLRFFHGTAEHWIAQGVSVDEVLDCLDEGQFETEFAPRGLEEARRALRAQWRERAA